MARRHRALRALALFSVATAASCESPTESDPFDEVQPELTAVCVTPNDAIAQLLDLDLATGERDVAADIFLEVPGIPGEASHKGHEGEIDVVSFSWGTSMEVSGELAASGTSGTVRVADLVIRKLVDSSSPALEEAASSGDVIPEVHLTIRTGTSADGEEVYLTITLTEATVASISRGEDLGGTTTEHVALTFERVDHRFGDDAECATSLDPVADFLGLGLDGGALETLVDHFLKLEGVDGESQDADHKGEIDIVSFGWTLSTEVSSAMSGASIGVGVVGDVVLVREVDSASPLLVKYADSGDPIETGVLSVRKTDGDGVSEELVVDLLAVSVVSVETMSSSAMERVTLNVEGVEPR